MVAASPRPPGHVFDLDAIAAALEALLFECSHEVSGGIGVGVDPADILRRMLDGYTFVDELLLSGRDPFIYGGSHLLLELNHLVLCGTSLARRTEYAAHLAATERRFYEDHLRGADSFYAWAEHAQHLKPLAYAAGAFRQIVSTPQLFIEGNQRTATLVASYVLGRAGLPPLVTTVQTLSTFLTLSTACKMIDRRRLSSAFWGWALEHQLQRFIAHSADARFLGTESAQTTSTKPGNMLP